MLYRLPARDIPADQLNRLNVWLRDFVPLDAAQANQKLINYWSKLTSPSLIKLAERLLPIHEASIVFDAAEDVDDELKKDYGDNPGRTWLMWRTPKGSCKNPKTKERDSHSFLLGPPIAVNDIERRINKFASADQEILIEFFQCFQYLCESPPPYAGNFISPAAWQLVRSKKRFSKWNGANDWLDAITLYHASSGDYVLLHPSGKIAWAQMETQEIVPLRNTFAEFIDHYVAYKEYNWPFDSWGADHLGIS